MSTSTPEAQLPLGGLSGRRLIDLQSNIRGPVKRKLYGLVGEPVEKMLSVSTLNQLYDVYRAQQSEARGGIATDLPWGASVFLRLWTF